MLNHREQRDHVTVQLYKTINIAGGIASVPMQISH